MRQDLIRAAGVHLEAPGSGAGRESLARAIRAVAFDALLRRAPGLADDLAQSTTLRVLRAFEGGCTTADRLPAYVVAAAHNAHRSHLRRAGSTREELTGDVEDAPTENAAGPEQDLADAEQAQGEAERLRAILPDAPAAYREVIVAHYLEERSIEDLVEAEVTARLTRDGRDPSDPIARHAARLNARRTIDQRLSRARSWLAKRLRGGGGDA